MTGIASTPEGSYYAVIFTSVMNENAKGYEEMAKRMLTMAAKQEGYLGVENARDEDGTGITVSYWESVEAIMRWKQAGEHQGAQHRGMSEWYKAFRVRICKVEREYGS